MRDHPAGGALPAADAWGSARGRRGRHTRAPRAQKSDSFSKQRLLVCFVRKPLEIRNRIVHDPWFKTTEAQQMKQLTIGAKGALTYTFKQIDLGTFQVESELVRKAMFEASEIRDAIEVALPTLPEIPLGELHPTVLHSGGSPQSRASDKTFLLFPPKPSDPLREVHRQTWEAAQKSRHANLDETSE